VHLVGFYYKKICTGLFYTCRSDKHTDEAEVI